MNGSQVAGVDSSGPSLREGALGMTGGECPPHGHGVASGAVPAVSRPSHGTNVLQDVDHQAGLQPIAAEAGPLGTRLDTAQSPLLSQPKRGVASPGYPRGFSQLRRVIGSWRSRAATAVRPKHLIHLAAPGGLRQPAPDGQGARLQAAHCPARMSRTESLAGLSEEGRHLSAGGWVKQRAMRHPSSSCRPGDSQWRASQQPSDLPAAAGMVRLSAQRHRRISERPSAGQIQG